MYSPAGVGVTVVVPDAVTLDEPGTRNAIFAADHSISVNSIVASVKTRRSMPAGTADSPSISGVRHSSPGLKRGAPRVAPSLAQVPVFGSYSTMPELRPRLFGVVALA